MLSHRLARWFHGARLGFEAFFFFGLNWCVSDRVTLVSRNIPLDGADFLRSESGPWTGETPVQASSGEAREFVPAAPQGSAQGQGTLVALGPGGRGRLPLSPKLTVLLSSSNTLLKNVFFCKWLGVFSYTLFLVKHEKGRMPNLVGHTYIYSGGGPPQSLCVCVGGLSPCGTLVWGHHGRGLYLYSLP